MAENLQKKCLCNSIIMLYKINKIMGHFWGIYSDGELMVYKQPPCAKIGGKSVQK